MISRSYEASNNGYCPYYVTSHGTGVKNDLVCKLLSVAPKSSLILDNLKSLTNIAEF